MKKIFLVLFAIISLGSLVTAQEKLDYMEVFLIDAYVKQEPPYMFILSFYSNKSCMGKVIIDGKYEYVVSDTLTESHSAKIDISALKFLNKNVDFVIVTVDSLGNKFTTEQFEFDLPFEPVITEGSSLWTLGLFAASVFLLPAPGYVISDGNEYFSLTKDIPLISFRSKKGNYPAAYFSFEYTYIFNAENRNFVRFGYKKIFQTDLIEYIAPGITAYTNFAGQNGFAPEVSVGWLTLFDTYTLYARYRYNFKPGDSNSNFHEINIGLYTRFFSLYF
jgi:hypothetical protein